MSRQHHVRSFSSLWSTWAVLLLVVLAAAPLAAQNTPAKKPPAKTPPAKSATTAAVPAAAVKPVPLNWLPADTALAFVARPSTVWTDQELRTAVEGALPKKVLAELQEIVGPLEEIESVMIAFPRHSERAVGEATLFYTKLKAVDWDALMKKQLPALVKFTAAGQQGEPGEGRFAGKAYYAIDSRTVALTAIDTMPAVIKQIGAGKDPVWAPAWQHSDIGQAGLFVSMRWLKEQLSKELRGDEKALVALLSPLVDETSYLTVGANVVGKLKLQARAICRNTEGAQNVHDTTQAVLVLANNALRELPAKLDPEVAKVLTPPLNLGDTLLRQSQLAVEEKQAVLRLEAPVTAAAALKTLLPLFGPLPVTASKATSNNLKNIALAFHNYEAVNGRFPAASNLGPDGKTPHSWRVAILPYLEQQALYDAYHFDEPWDSPHNKKLAETIVPVYRHPNAPADSTSSSYFVLTGPDTPFNGAKLGFAQFRDGLSNTLLVVEAKRAIPWTKPEDIPYDAKKKLPALGGFFPDGFYAAFADGAVREFSVEMPDDILRSMITPNGNDTIERPAD